MNAGTSQGKAWAGLRFPYHGQSEPYSLLLRPESPYGRGALDLAIETASTRVARLGCTLVAGFHRIGGQDNRQRQWQHSIATSITALRGSFVISQRSECRTTEMIRFRPF
jgi:hypothetical protein